MLSGAQDCFKRFLSQQFSWWEFFPFGFLSDTLIWRIRGSKEGRRPVDEAHESGSRLAGSPFSICLLFFLFLFSVGNPVSKFRGRDVPLDPPFPAVFLWHDTPPFPSAAPASGSSLFTPPASPLIFSSPLFNPPVNDSREKIGAPLGNLHSPFFPSSRFDSYLSFPLPFFFPDLVLDATQGGISTARPASSSSPRPAPF